VDELHAGRGNMLPSHDATLSAVGVDHLTGYFPAGWRIFSMRLRNVPRETPSLRAGAWRFRRAP
jgi:hypothetical protein